MDLTGLDPSGMIFACSACDPCRYPCSCVDVHMSLGIHITLDGVLLFGSLGQAMAKVVLCGMDTHDHVYPLGYPG